MGGAPSASAGVCGAAPSSIRLHQMRGAYVPERFCVRSRTLSLRSTRAPLRRFVSGLAPQPIVPCACCLGWLPARLFAQSKCRLWCRWCTYVGSVISGGDASCTIHCCSYACLLCSYCSNVRPQCFTMHTMPYDDGLLPCSNQARASPAHTPARCTPHTAPC